MRSVLSRYNHLDSIQILSHGAPGSLSLGATLLDNASLYRYADSLAAIGASLTETGDILLYGCNVADGAAGKQFIDTLAQMTGADIAASGDLTGTTVLGGQLAVGKTRRQYRGGRPGARLCGLAD